jgi:hypothetical protein
MRPATFVFLLFSVLFVFQVSSVLAAISITCGQCQQGNCNCNINGCPGESGLLSIYLTNQCSGSPVFKVPFTSSVGVWSPDNSGLFYGRALCDDRTTKSDCSPISVTQTIACNDNSCKQTCTNNGNITGSCDANNQCQCYGTSESKSKCSDDTPYEECSSEKPKYCTSSGELIDDCNRCGCSSDSENCNSNGSCENTSNTPSGGGSDMGLWIGIIIVIIIAFVIVYFLFFRKKKSRSSTKASYEDLYRKWSR